ncbi:polygalacturonase inhibitor 2-like [Lotus japonicus]|uniref:polygalacturonase inhibitor 2-like n=1 Tax=Lotus japonicus TaxID=34305 RepID=UPI0025853856|nr:polygalacturonase inhibitor 2-like [Lotus japonicus]
MATKHSATPFLMLLLTITCFFPLSLSEKCKPREKTALLQFKKELGNPTELSSWNTTTDCCDPAWEGVTCDAYNQTYRVIILDLYNLNLPNPHPIPASVANLPHLNILSLRNIPNLIGPIPPAITKLTELNYLTVSHTSIFSHIPDFLSQITTLVTFDFSYNNLTGPLPPSISTLPNFVGITANDNKLSGAIPYSYGSFSNLFTSLTLNHNQLSGKIPASLSKLNLAFVDLSMNMLEGDASVFFGSEKNTQKIILARNSLAFDLGKVGLSSNLNTIDLRNNRVYGTLPQELTGLKFLKKLNVSYNSLCGQIPQGGNLQRFDVYSYAHNKCLCGSPLPACKT